MPFRSKTSQFPYTRKTMKMERFANLTTLDIRLASMKVRLANGSPPPGLQITQDDPNFKLAQFPAGGRMIDISLTKVPQMGGAWGTGFKDSEQHSTDEATGQAGHGAMAVFQKFIQALLYLLDKYKIERWFFGGEKSRVRLYNKLIERAIKIHPELAEEWELESHQVGQFPGRAEEVGGWMIRRKNSR